MAFFELGKIIKTRGLKGCLKVVSYAENNDVFLNFEYLYLRTPAGDIAKFDIAKINLSGRFLFIELRGIDNREKAQALLNCTLLVPRSFYPEPAENEYYWHDLVGLEVVSANGSCLGRIESIFPTPGHDIYVCRKEGREYLLPATTKVIKNIDLGKKIMTVELPEGL